MAEHAMEVADRVSVELAGEHDAVLRALEERLGIDIDLRGNQVVLKGDEVRVERGAAVIEELARLVDSGLVDGYFTQDNLRSDVSRRLKANLASAGTIKRLYDVLEPELHGYIPKDDVKSSLPSCVAPVVDDLRKLGAVLPETPKATEKKE